LLASITQPAAWGRAWWRWKAEHHPRGVRGLPRASLGTLARAEAQVVVMDNLSSQKGGRVSELIEERGCELVVYLHRPTRRRTSTPSRRPLCQSEGVAQGDRGAHSRSFGGSAGQGARCGHGPGRSCLLRALRLPCDGSIAMTDALISQTVVCC
jgi:hypothetical protein